MKRTSRKTREVTIATGKSDSSSSSSFWAELASVSGGDIGSCGALRSSKWWKKSKWNNLLLTLMRRQNYSQFHNSHTFLRMRWLRTTIVRRMKTVRSKWMKDCVLTTTLSLWNTKTACSLKSISKNPRRHLMPKSRWMLLNFVRTTMPMRCGRPNTPHISRESMNVLQRLEFHSE